jgi:hypothetical protein
MLETLIVVAYADLFAAPAVVSSTAVPCVPDTVCVHGKGMTGVQHAKSGLSQQRGRHVQPDMWMLPSVNRIAKSVSRVWSMGTGLLPGS